MKIFINALFTTSEFVIVDRKGAMIDKEKISNDEIKINKDKYTAIK